VVELYSDFTWQFKDSKTSEKCTQLSLKITFCGDTNWFRSKNKDADPAVIAQFSHKKGYAMVIEEAMGENDGVSMEILLEAVLNNAADGLGLRIEEIPVLLVEDTIFKNNQGKLLVTSIDYKGMKMIMVYTILLNAGQSVQLVTWAITDKHDKTSAELHSSFLKLINISD
jgi:hypothetical protein